MPKSKIDLDRVFASLARPLPGAAKVLIEATVSIAVLMTFLAYVMASSAQSDVIKRLENISVDATYMQVLNFEKEDGKTYEAIKQIEEKLSKEKSHLLDLESRKSQIFTGSTNFFDEEEIDIQSPKITENLIDNIDSEINSTKALIVKYENTISYLYRQANLPADARKISDDLNQIESIFPLYQICNVGICPLDTPPVIMALPLIFTSGLFGSILFQLIIKVYPETRFTDSRTSSFLSRVLLGGAISVALFVFLASGIAVLGSSESFVSGDRNTFALASIGVLAGMFSNRVAGWLSSRADIFLRKEDETVESATPSSP